MKKHVEANTSYSGQIYRNPPKWNPNANGESDNSDNDEAAADSDNENDDTDDDADNYEYSVGDEVLQVQDPSVSEAATVNETSTSASVVSKSSRSQGNSASSVALISQEGKSKFSYLFFNSLF